MPNYDGAAPIVFIVDDDLSVRRSTERLIRSAGLEVQTFTSAREFLKHPRPDRPALFEDGNLIESTILRACQEGKILPPEACMRGAPHPDKGMAGIASSPSRD